MSFCSAPDCLLQLPLLAEDQNASGIPFHQRFGAQLQPFSGSDTPVLKEAWQAPRSPGKIFELLSMCAQANSTIPDNLTLLLDLASGDIKEALPAEQVEHTPLQTQLCLTI